MHRRLIPLLVAIALASVVTGCSGSSGAPTIEDVWARPGTAGAESAAYLTITGSAGGADALLSASSPGANMVELHEVSTDTDGMTGMHPIDRLDIPAGVIVRLEPGGYHLMIMGLKADLAVGGTLQLELVFEKAGKVTVEAEIRQG
jgi:copper(I)-binding protein